MPKTTYRQRAARRRANVRAVLLGAIFGGFLMLGMGLAPGNEPPACDPIHAEC